MKKHLWVLGTALLLLTGCAVKPSAPSVHAAVDTDMTLQYGGGVYDCHVRYVAKNNAVLTLSSPDSLAGLTFHRTDGAYSLSLGSLLCKGTQLLPQDTAMAEAVFAVFDRLSDTAPDCTGTTAEGNYTFAFPSDDTLSLTTDSSGWPVAIRTEELTLTTAGTAVTSTE